MSQLNVNTINERTSNSGVTIDSVLIKDGVVAGKATEDCLLYTSPSPRDS